MIKSIFMSLIRCINNFIMIFFRFKRVLIDTYYLSWVDIEPHQLKRELFRNKSYGILLTWEPFTPSLIVSDKIEYLSDAITYRVCNELECQKKDLNFNKASELSIANANQYANWALIHARKVIDKTKPSTVLFIQGYTMESAALRSACIEKSIPFIGMENTSRYDRILWDDCSGITVNRNLAKNFFWKFHDHVSVNEINSYHEKYIKNQKRFKSMEHSSPSHTYNNPDNKPLLTWIGQVYTDSSVLFGLNQGFTTPIQCIRALLSFALDHEYRVFLKMHPKEYNGKNILGNSYNQLTARRIREDILTSDLLMRLGNNLVFDDDNCFDTYSVIDNSSLVATVNSQAGLESAIRGVPVLLCGNAFYGGLGFTKEANSEREIFLNIAELLDSRMEPAHAEEAKRFNYIFFEKYCIPKTADSIAQLATSSTIHGHR